MKKTLIALAAVAAASASFAQSSATVYGVADLYVGKATASANGLNTSVGAVLASGAMSGSRLGFRAVEDLGSGMSATIVYETAVAPDTPAASSLGSRVATLALASGANSLTLGRQYTPALYYVTSNSAIGAHNQDFSSTNASVSSNNSIAYGYNAAPFSILVMAGLKEDGTTEGGNAGAFTGIGGTYTAGALVLGAAIEADSVSTAGATASNYTGLSATYNFGAFSLGGSANSLRNSGNLDGSNRTGFGLQAAIPFNNGVNAVHFAYGTNAASGAASSSNTSTFSGLFNHSMSKATNAYAFYRQENMDSNAGLYANGVANRQTSTMGVGVRKSF
jgi:predicted porin